ncbi:hypothetical protein BJG92_00582 [Arthrobacter sp. SO5]|uniref:GAF domain-containing protein n=1 Tax=Arthrobacter sp. SO5 TaxID=1897055 RepID=UPI001E5075BE|nr:GAF domain-containing protein [Arthrobacter sp. SO5]MCB5273070.1 hypothetical protein [Arthrobacter sp. SO5]
MTEGSTAGGGPKLPAVVVGEMRFDSRDIGAYFGDAMAEFVEDIGGTGRGISWSITVIRSGEAATLTAGSAASAAVDAVEASFDDGPARAAVRSGEFVLVADTRMERRWPGYASAAAALGTRSVLSLPLVPADVFRAVINLYAPWPHVFTSADITAAARFVRHTSRNLHLAQQLALGMKNGADLSSAQLSRALAGLALRTLIREYGFSSEAALEYLRSVAGNFSPEFLEVNLRVLITDSDADRSMKARSNPGVGAARSAAAPLVGMTDHRTESPAGA